MSVTAADIVQAAIEAAAAELKKHGMETDVARLPRLFAEALRTTGQIGSVTLVTPSGDSGELKSFISKAFEKKFGHPVEIQEKADPSLIGGAVVLFGDERIDLSLKSTLLDLEEKLRTGGIAAID